MQERITEIEIKLAHLEQAVNELSDVLYRQQNLLERLESGYENLRHRIISDDTATDSPNPADDKPPHY
jgi:SlyX protein